MKDFTFLCLSTLCMALLTGCIKDEAANAECDIVALDEAWKQANAEVLRGYERVENNEVTIYVADGTDLSAFNPKFVLTPGATITMKVDGQDVAANGVTRNFNEPQIYTTHSEDGLWHKDYKVGFDYYVSIDRMSFEHYELDPSGRYQVWYERDEVPSKDDPSQVKYIRHDYWANGNGGYALVGIAKKPEDYPTAAHEDGVNGMCARLETRRTGSFGDMVKMPIAAGNLFIGTFDTKIAMREPRNATHFGLPLVQDKPVLLKGYYKYTQGEVFTDKNKKVCPERKDTADIYAVIYECDPQNFVALNGDEVLSSPRIVMMARINNPGEPQEWEEFYVPFKSFEGRSIDMERLKRGEYAIAVVATSSRQGAYFEGAIGSVLWVDELRVVWQLDDDADELRTKMEQYLETHPDER